VLTYLDDQNIPLTLAGLMTPYNMVSSGTDGTGYGLEGYSSIKCVTDNLAELASAIGTINASDHTSYGLDYIQLVGPFTSNFAGPILIDGTLTYSTNYDLKTLANNIAINAAAADEVFPNVQVGDAGTVDGTNTVGIIDWLAA
jgi:hypothetical protein